MQALKKEKQFSLGQHIFISKLIPCSLQHVTTEPAKGATIQGPGIKEAQDTSFMSPHTELTYKTPSHEKVWEMASTTVQWEMMKLACIQLGFSNYLEWNGTPHFKLYAEH